MRSRIGIAALLILFSFVCLTALRGATSWGAPRANEVSQPPPVKTTVIAEVNVNHGGQSDLAVAIPRNATLDDTQYWCKEGVNDVASAYLMAAAGDTTHGCPYQFAHWSTAVRFKEVDGVNDAVQATFVNEHSSVPRRARLVVVYH